MSAGPEGENREAGRVPNYAPGVQPHGSRSLWGAGFILGGVGTLLMLPTGADPLKNTVVLAGLVFALFGVYLIVVRHHDP
jgi:hypothetical protein